MTRYVQARAEIAENPDFTRTMRGDGILMRNLIIAILLLGIAGFAFTKWKLHRDVEEGVDALLLMLAPVAQIEYESISSTLGGELTIDGIRGRVSGFSDDFHIGRLGIDTPGFLSLMKLGDLQGAAMSGENPLPESFGVIVDGLRMPVDSDYGRYVYEVQLEARGAGDVDPAGECTGRHGFSPDALLAMGYDEYDVSMRASFHQRGGRYVVEMTTASRDMWDVDAELNLVGDMAREISKGPAYRPKMQSARLEYTDRSLRERVTEHCRRLGLSDAEVRAAQFEAFMELGLENGIEFDEYMTGPYAEFLDGKATFVVTAEPNEPIVLSQIALYKPSDVPALLQLTGEAR